MFGLSAFCQLPFASVLVGLPQPILIYDFHDGGKRKKQEEKERKRLAAKNKAKRDEIIALFEQIVEGKPKIAEEIAEPFIIAQATAEMPMLINFDAMLNNLDKVNQIYNALIEMDDEDVLLLL
jgi:hypothetical protein